MGNIYGFLKHKSEKASFKPVKDRIRNYKEFVIPLSNKKISIQASRCMDCGIPYCHSIGCPLFNLIPEWNDLIYKNFWYEAYRRLELTNPLPEITGRVCPAPCETACTLSINDNPVTIKQIELAIIEKAFSEGWIKPVPPEIETGKKIAVIGSGPAGISAAQSLRGMGHKVTVFEKNKKIGGILRYGIPDYKLEKCILDRRIDILKKEGILFETDVIIGEDISVRYLRKSFDVILLTIGAEKPRDLSVPGRGFEGIYFAMHYLTESNKFVSGQINNQEIISARNKDVLVIGGGDTGSDCIGTARRQGANNIYQFEILPKPQTWENTHNPIWPYWPNILRTSSSHEEGVERIWSVLTKSFSGRGVRVELVNCCKAKWTLDKNGNPLKMTEIPGSNFNLKVDLVFIAMGFLHVRQNKLLKNLKLEYDKKGNIKIDKNYKTSAKGVFAAGDAVTGASLVVRAIYYGYEAAKCINEYLK